MKKLLFALLLFPSLAFAFGDFTHDESQDQTQWQGQDQKQRQSMSNYQRSQADANAKSYSDSNSKSSSGAASIAGSHSNTGDMAVSLTQQYKAVSASAASLDLPYCGEGISAQGDEGGFSMGNTNFICESQMALKMSLILVDMEMAGYEANKENDPMLADGHLIKAHAHMLKAESILFETVDYIERRSDTAALAAGAKDIAWPALLLGLLVLAL